MEARKLATLTETSLETLLGLRDSSLLFSSSSLVICDVVLSWTYPTKSQGHKFLNIKCCQKDKWKDKIYIPADLDHHKASASLPLRLSQLELLLPKPAITSTYFSIKMGSTMPFSIKTRLAIEHNFNEIIRLMTM